MHLCQNGTACRQWIDFQAVCGSQVSAVPARDDHCHGLKRRAVDHLSHSSKNRTWRQLPSTPNGDRFIDPCLNPRDFHVATTVSRPSGLLEHRPVMAWAIEVLFVFMSTQTLLSAKWKVIHRYYSGNPKSIMGCLQFIICTMLI